MSTELHLRNPLEQYHDGRDYKAELRVLLAGLEDRSRADAIAKEVQHGVDADAQLRCKGIVMALELRPDSTGAKRGLDANENDSSAASNKTKKPKKSGRYTEWMLSMKLVAALEQCTAKQVPGQFTTAFKAVYNDKTHEAALADLYSRTETKFKPEDSTALLKEHLPVDLAEWANELYQVEALQPFFDAACAAVMAVETAKSDVQEECDESQHAGSSTDAEKDAKKDAKEDAKETTQKDAEKDGKEEAE